MSSTAPFFASRELNQLPWTALLRFGSLALFILSLLAAALLGDPQAAVPAAIGLALGLLIVRAAFRSDEHHLVLTLFLVAFAVRVAAAVASHHLLVFMGRGGFALLDDRAYDKLGWTLARVWLGVFPGIRDSDQYLLVNYTYLVAAVYWSLGHSLLAAKMLNPLFGALTAVVIYALGRDLFGRRTGLIAAVITAAFPSLFLWSVINLKDTLVVLLTATAIFGLIRYARHHEWWALALCLAAFLGIENLRQFVFFSLTWLLPIGFVFADRSERKNDSGRVLLAVVLGVLLTAVPALYLVNNGQRDYLVILLLVLFIPTLLFFLGSSDRRRKVVFLAPLVLAIMSCSYLTNNEKLGVNFLTPKALTEAEWKRWLEESKALSGNDEFGGIKPPKDASDIVNRSMAYLPRGMLAVVFGPVPWQAESSSERAVVPEMLLWYGLLAAAAVGLLTCWRQRWRELALPLSFTVAWIAALALTEGNTGNIFRHRSQFLPYVFLLSGAGLDAVLTWRRVRALRQRSLTETAAVRPQPSLPGS